MTSLLPTSHERLAPTSAPTAALAPDAHDPCAREPIHLPGSIQPYGALLVIRSAADPLVLQASANAGELTGLGPAIAPGAVLDQPELLATLRAEGDAQRSLRLGDRHLLLRLHDSPQGLLVELEPATADDAQALEGLYGRLQRFLDAIEAEPAIDVLARIGAAELRRLTGFDRILVYRFDEGWHGRVIAEDGNGRLPSYLDLHFPATDIPAQARELYRRNRLRLIASANYVPVPVLPAASPVDGAALDLSDVGLRSVSPVHLEYMRNMGTEASMSLSILVDGQLWGLVACHHATPWIVGPRVRVACDFIGQVLSLQIGARERVDEAARRLVAKHAESELLARVAKASSLQSGLVQNPDAWLRLVRANGAAVLTEGSVLTAGRTPRIEQLLALAQWLHQQRGTEPVWWTYQLPSLYPAAPEISDCACGVLAVSISALHPQYVMWFLPELIHTVSWGGQPDKVLGAEGGPLRPRRSFGLWTEHVRGQSRRWSAVEVEAALSFRNSMVEFVLKRAEERAELTTRLEASNKELEAFSYSVSHDLRAPFRHIVGFAQLLGETEQALAPRSRHYLDTIIDSALSAGRLVDDLLNFSQLGRTSLDLGPVDMDKVVDEVRRSLRMEQGERAIEWRVERLPAAWGDGSLLRQTVANLIGNALKYTRGREPAVIQIGGETRSHETVYFVRDNGVGFDMEYVGKLFGVFQRLHRVEEFEGSGIGLALSRRIIDRHGGWIAAEGALNEGATFRFGLPRP